MASARPVLASVDEDSDTWKLIERSQSGMCVPAANSAALAKAILELKNNAAQRQQMGMNGRMWAEKYHSPQAAAEQIEQLLVDARGV